MSLTECLLKAQSPNFEERTLAEKNIQAAQEGDFSKFVQELAGELRNEDKPPITRQLAGVILKNAFSATDRKLDKQKRDAWTQLNPELCNFVKTAALETVTSACDEARSAACQVVSKVARIEVPAKRWENVLPFLVDLILSEKSTSLSKRGGLTAISFFCEDFQVLVEETQSYAHSLTPPTCNLILSAIATGMKDTDKQVKLAATKALFFAVPFSYHIFQKEDERKILLDVVGMNLQYGEDILVRQAAWEAVIEIAEEYYEYLQPYMPVLAKLSIEAIVGAEEPTALPAVEFWSKVCDEEICILAKESDRTMMNFISQAKEHLLPVLFDAMTRQTSEETEEMDWTLSMAAGACVGLCAEVLKDDILDITLAFVNKNFNAPEWNQREAAFLAYGSIMEGPSGEKLSSLVGASFQMLCQRLDDSSVAVRDTTAWTIGRIIKFQFPSIKSLLGTPEQTGLLAILLPKLKDEPRVANQICFAIDAIATNCEVMTNPQTGEESTQLDVWLRPMTEALFQVVQRQDLTDGDMKLRASAYTAIASVVNISRGPDKTALVVSVVEKTAILLEQTLAVPQTTEVTSLQCELCGCLEACVRALGAEATPIAARLFTLFFNVMGTHHGTSTTSSPAPEGEATLSMAADDALLAISTLANAIGIAFEPFTERLCLILHQGLQNREDESFCEKCIDVVGDLARILGTRFSTFCRPLLQDIYMMLKDVTARPALKPRAMMVIGDVALNIGQDFESFLSVFLEILKQATQTKISDGPEDNEDWVEFIQNLRDGVLWAYSGIIHGLRETNRQEILNFQLFAIVDFIRVIVEDVRSSETNFLKAVELLADLVTVYQDILPHIKDAPFLAKMVQIGKASPDDNIKQGIVGLEQLLLVH